MKRLTTALLSIAFLIVLLAGCSPVADAPSASQNAGTDELVLTLNELAAYNGQDGSPAYIAVDGIIYDVTEDIGHWQDGMHNGFSAGSDLTQEIKEISPHGVSKLSELQIVGRLAD